MGVHAEKKVMLRPLHLNGTVSFRIAATVTAHTMDNAKPIRDRGDGQMIYGPSGAPIWNSPAIDAKRNFLYVGIGEATSEPASPNTDAILAINLKDGSIQNLSRQTAP